VRTSLAAWLSAVLLPLACGPSERPAAPPRVARPDILLVTIDTWRADAAGFAGSRDVETPLLDRLAASGTVFTDAHAHNVVTLPSHANILTGLYPFQHGVRDNAGFVLDSSVPTLAGMLHDSGYATGAFVGAFPLDSRFGLDRGFDVYDDDYPLGSQGARLEVAERRGDAVVAAALDWWRAHAGEPRFLWVHLYDPHAAYAPPEPFASRYRSAPYLGEVAAVDSFLTPLVEPHLDGKEPPALVVVTGDHGEALGDHGELTHGLFAYEATLHVPLVVWGAGVPARRDDRSARHIDIAPTLLAAAGIESARRLPGSSLLAPPAPADSYFEALSMTYARGWAPLRGVLRERRKMIDLPLPELYSLPDDPEERNNLAAQRSFELRELRQALPAASAWPPDERRTPSSEEAARLRSLGYAAGSAPLRSSYGPADDPKNLIAVDAKLHQVIDAYSRGDFERAVALAREVLATHPEIAEAYDNLALSLRQLERNREAIAVLRDGIAHASVKRDLIRQLGMTLVENGQPDEAVSVLAPFESSSDPEALRAFGGALSAVGDQPRALAVLQRAAALVPDDPQIVEAMGIAELRLDHVAEATALLRQALARNPQLATAWNSLGVALFRSEGGAAAIAAWQKALEIDPHLYDAIYNVGWVAANMGDRRTAREAFQRYVATAPPERFAAEIAKARTMLAQLGD